MWRLRRLRPADPRATPHAGPHRASDVAAHTCGIDSGPMIDRAGSTDDRSEPHDDADLRADVVVIGAGWAGLSAAVQLAESGRRVVVVEEAPRLGGRASTFVDRASGEAVDNGQHVLFGCYRDTYAFLS